MSALRKAQGPGTGTYQLYIFVYFSFHLPKTFFYWILQVITNFQKLFLTYIPVMLQVQTLQLPCTIGQEDYRVYVNIQSSMSNQQE